MFLLSSLISFLFAGLAVDVASTTRNSEGGANPDRPQDPGDDDPDQPRDLWSRAARVRTGWPAAMATIC